MEFQKDCDAKSIVEHLQMVFQDKIDSTMQFEILMGLHNKVVKPNLVAGQTLSGFLIDKITNAYASDLQDESQKPLNDESHCEVHHFLLEDILGNLAKAINDEEISIFNINRSTVWEGALRGFRRYTYSPTKRISVKFTDDVGHSEAVRSDDYFIAGRAIAVSLVHGGPPPRFLATELYDALVRGPENVTCDFQKIPDEDLKSKLEKVKSQGTDSQRLQHESLEKENEELKQESLEQEIETLKQESLEQEIKELKQERDKLEKKNESLVKDIEELKQDCDAIRKKFTEVTLKPDTASPSLTVSEDGSQVRFKGEGSAEWSSVLGIEGFTSGRHYWEVEVGEKGYWALGISTYPDEKIIPEKPEEGYCLVRRWRGNTYEAVSQSLVPLTLQHKLYKVGMILDCEKKKLSFYNVYDGCKRYKIHTFTYKFTEVYPIFSPGSHDRGPLKITRFKSGDGNPNL
ncbi:UNVERIFIED_CONTAM: hypothetical protein FKN15_033926 [Acipenser sinensis]